MSTYDAYVSIHSSNGYYAHRGPAFLPWHREYLHRMEEELRRVSGDDGLTIPYWNWASEDDRMRVFSPQWVGGNGSAPFSYVDDGPFAQWPDLNLNGTIVPSPIVRALGVPITNMSAMPWMEGPSPPLPSLEEVISSLSIPLFDSPPFDDASHSPPSFRNHLEGWKDNRTCTMHNAVHVYCGGVMRTVAVAPNDPLFFLHHSFVDKLYSLWQSMWGEHDMCANATGGCGAGGYVPLNGARKGHNYGDEMVPFALPVAWGVNLSNYNYPYQLEPLDQAVTQIIRGNREEKGRDGSTSDVTALLTY